MEHDGIESSEIGQLGQSELDGIGRSGLGMSEFDMSSPLNYGTPSSNNPVGSQVRLFQDLIGQFGTFYLGYTNQKPS